MIPQQQRHHVIYEPNADGTYNVYTVVSASCASQMGIPGAMPAPMSPTAPMMPSPVRGPSTGAMPVPEGEPTACRLGAKPGAGMQPLGSSSAVIHTDHGDFKIDDPRLLYVVISRKDGAGKKVSRDAANAIVKGLGLKSSKKSRGQFVRSTGDGISQACLNSYWYFRFTTLDKHDAEAPKLTFCVTGVKDMGGCSVYVIAQDMSKRAAHGKYKEVPPLQATGAPKATK